MITSSVSRTSRRLRAWLAITCLLALCLAILLGEARGFADGPEGVSEAALLQARFDRLVARTDAQYAEGAIEQASRALETASKETDDPERASRARRIAKAAVVLAERQLDRRRVQTELIETQKRLTANRERAQAQRRVLEALMKERASLARAGEQP